jgi:hypothetical protein
MACSVCAPETMSANEVVVLVNLIHSTGISSGWRLSEDEKFKSGETIPAICNQVPGRQHWLLEC